MAGAFDFGQLFKVTYAASTAPVEEWSYLEGCQCYECSGHKPIEHRDDSGIPEWLLQDNETYFRELHRVVDDVPAPLGVRISR
jgi:hypothetical protein